jgi:hypothetical protein
MPVIQLWEILSLGISQFQVGLGRKARLYLKDNQNKNSWRYGSNGRNPA